MFVENYFLIADFRDVNLLFKKIYHDYFLLKFNVLSSRFLFTLNNLKLCENSFFTGYINIGRIINRIQHTYTHLVH